MIRFKDVIRRSMTKEKINWEKTDPITFYIERPLSYPLTWLFLNLRISANAASFISILVSIVALVLSCFSSYFWLSIACWICLFVWSILDCVDGNIARFNKTASLNGELWDATAGYIAMAILFFCPGIMCFYEKSVCVIPINQELYIIFGALSSFMCLIPRIVMHKKNSFTDISNEFKDRKNFGLLKKLMSNVLSITGFALFLLLFAIIFKFCNLYVLFYLLINFLMCVYSLASLLRDGSGPKND